MYFKKYMLNTFKYKTKLLLKIKGLIYNLILKKTSKSHILEILRM